MRNKSGIAEVDVESTSTSSSSGSLISNKDRSWLLLFITRQGHWMGEEKDVNMFIIGITVKWSLLYHKC